MADYERGKYRLLWFPDDVNVISRNQKERAKKKRQKVDKIAQDEGVMGH